MQQQKRLTDAQCDILAARFGAGTTSTVTLPRSSLRALLREAFTLGLAADVMHVKYKDQQ